MIECNCKYCIITGYSGAGRHSEGLFLEQDDFCPGDLGKQFVKKFGLL